MAMITPDFVAMMADYNAEMNRRVYGAAGRLPAAERRADGGLFWRSIQGTLSHLIWADEMWLSRFGVGQAPRVGIAESDRCFDDFEVMAARRGTLDAAIRDWAAALRPEDLAGDLVWMSGATGRELTKPRAMCVVQIFNHQTHHRGQVHALLTRAGEDTGATDLFFIL
jgi:uncharacterized damage-inducible protein DinB